jgi:hypothetical protein
MIPFPARSVSGRSPSRVPNRSRTYERWHGEVEPTPTLRPGEGADEGVPVHPRNLYDEQVPRVGVRVRDGLREIDPRDPFDPGEVPVGELHPTGVERRDLAHLDHPDRGVEIGQVVLVPRLPDVVVRGAPLSVPPPCVPLDPVESKQPKARGEGVVVTGDHPPLGRREVLDRVEGEDRDVSRGARTRRAADGDALVHGAHGVRGILDHGDPGAVCRRADRVEVGRRAGEMDGDHRLRAWGDPCRERVGPHLERPVVDVDEDGGRPAQDDLVDGGGERHRGGGHLVPRADPQGREDDVEPGGGGGDRDGVRPRWPRGRFLPAPRLSVRS